MTDELNKLAKKMLGKPMTKKQLRFQDHLRQKVKNKEITATDAHIIWSKKYHLNDLEFWKSVKESRRRPRK